ncbi:MAG: serine hydrolase domain-containing protein [Actinomycetota bacterium]
MWQRHTPVRTLAAILLIWAFVASACGSDAPPSSIERGSASAERPTPDSAADGASDADSGSAADAAVDQATDDDADGHTGDRDDDTDGHTDDDEVSSEPPVTCDPGIDAALAGWESVGFSGSVAFLGGEQECTAAYGLADADSGRPMTIDTTFSIGSITKSVSAAAIGRLAADGRLSLDDRAGDLVPGLTGAVGQATVAQLLLHTSGLTGSHGRDHEPLERADAIAALSSLDAAAPAGSEFLYSNAGFATVALIIDEVTGDYRRYLADQILTVDGSPITAFGGFWDGEPSAPTPRAVGVTDAGEAGHDGSFAGPHWALDGAGGVAMTAQDLARWTRALFTGDLLPNDGVSSLLELRFDQGDGTVEVPGWVGIDEEPFGEPVYGTSGGGGSIGHEMTVAWLPESERVFVIASNQNEVPAEQLLLELFHDLVAGRTPSPPDAVDDLPADVAQRAVGQWVLDGVPDGGRVAVSVDGDALLVTALDPGAVAAVLPIPDVAAASIHEALVLDVLGGSTEEGRRERELLEDELGSVVGLDVFGTWFADIEYRTYLRVRFERGAELLIWVAVDDRGGIAAAAVPVDPPSLRYVPRPDGTLAPLDRASAMVDLHLQLTDDGLLVINDGIEYSATADR